MKEALEGWFEVRGGRLSKQVVLMVRVETIKNLPRTPSYLNYKVSRLRTKGRNIERDTMRKQKSLKCKRSK